MGANDASPKTDVTARGILHRHKNWIQVTWNICSIINKTMQWSMHWNVCHLGMKLIGFILWNVKWIVLFRHHSASGWPSTHRRKTISRHNAGSHYNDNIMGAIASQITSLTIVYSTVYSDADQRKHQSSASLAFVRVIRRGPVKSPHKWPVTRKMSHLMMSSCKVRFVSVKFHLLSWFLTTFGY